MTFAGWWKKNSSAILDIGKKVINNPIVQNQIKAHTGIDTKRALSTVSAVRAEATKAVETAREVQADATRALETARQVVHTVPTSVSVPGLAKTVESRRRQAAASFGMVQRKVRHGKGVVRRIQNKKKM
jgi:hypothetical protein